MIIKTIILINLKLKQSKFLEEEERIALKAFRPRITDAIRHVYNATQKYLNWSVSSR